MRRGKNTAGLRTEDAEDENMVELQKEMYEDCDSDRGWDVLDYAENMVGAIRQREWGAVR